MTLAPLGFPGAPALRVTGGNAISGAEARSTCIPINSTTAFDFRFYDASGQFVWMDILEKRAGNWVVVKGAGDRVK